MPHLMFFYAYIKDSITLYASIKTPVFCKIISNQNYIDIISLKKGQILKFLIIFISIFLYSADFVEIYRTEGVSSLEKSLDKILSNKEYWLNRLKDKNVKWGYYENNKNILVCIKAKKILTIYKYQKSNNDFLQEGIYPVITGLEGDKQEQGDLKTPIGVYKLKTLIKNVDKFYGPFAFETEYPNLFDKIHKKTGYGIWIHGYPLFGKRNKNNTKGCIVLKNNLLKDLKQEINYKNSYLLISENQPLTATKEEIAKILAFLYRWRRAWRESDFNTYKIFYAKTFKTSDGKNLSNFLNYKKRVFLNKKGQNIEILFNNINIVPYQNINNKKIFRIDMLEKYISRNYKFEGEKELYVKFINNNLKIVLEKQ